MKIWLFVSIVRLSCKYVLKHNWFRAMELTMFCEFLHHIVE